MIIYRMTTMAVASVLFVLNSNSIFAQQWTKAFDTGDWSACYGASVDGEGNVFATGFTCGTIGGSKAKQKDAFLSKHDPEGKLIWAKLIGTRQIESGNDVLVGPAGAVYITGLTNGKLGETLKGGFDAFVAKYDGSGNLIWMRQFGTESYDEGQHIALDNNSNLLVTGWTKGSFEGSNFGGNDVFVVKFDSSGEMLWVQQIGTRDDDACFELAISEAGFLAVSGGTTGDFAGTNLGNRDAILAIFSPKGKLVSKFQLGTSEYDNAMAGAVGNEGNVFLAGETNGYFDKPGALNDSDVFLSKFQVELANPSAAGP